MVARERAKDITRVMLNELRALVMDSPSKKLSESDTKANFVDPLLAALGFSGIHDITREYYIKNSKDFIDYMLYISGAPVLAVEAKQLRHDLNLTDAAQLIQYASVEGIEWCALTNGRRMQLFNQFVKAPLEGKLIADLDLVAFNTDADFDALFDDLWLLSKESLGTPSGLKAWMDQRRFDTAMRTILASAKSETVLAAQHELAKAGIDANPEAITQWFASRLLTSVSSIPSDDTKKVHLPVPLPEPKSVPKQPQPGGTLAYWLFPASVRKAGKKDGSDVPVLESLHNWLDHSIWGIGKSTNGRTHVKNGDRACFYASGVGIVATAEIVGPATQIVTPAEWPEEIPADHDVYKVPLRDVRWFDAPIHLADKDVRKQLKAFAGKDLSRPWSWYVQSSGRMDPEDFDTICRNASL